MFALAVTDLRWHARFLAEPPEGPVNFWTPTPWNVRLAEGAKWGFMLKAPVRRIGGYGHFVRYETGRASDAWNQFGPGNGVDTLDELKARVLQFSRRRSISEVDEDDPEIGFVVLDGCAFLPEADQRAPEELGLTFQNAIVKFKRFDGELALPFEHALPDPTANFELVEDDGTSWELRRAKRRTAQGLFRKDVLEAYGGACAITGFTGREALDAAHIQPFVNMASNHIQNGLALRKDVHHLFDAGLIGVDEHLIVRVSPRLAGTSYMDLEGHPLSPPRDARHRPALAALELHRRSLRTR